jgi:hypothetical protein
MAERTGLEPAAFRVTGGRYNQLNYLSVVRTNVNTKIKANPLKIQLLIQLCPHLMQKTQLTTSPKLVTLITPHTK